VFAMQTKAVIVMGWVVGDAVERSLNGIHSIDHDSALRLLVRHKKCRLYPKFPRLCSITNGRVSCLCLI
jgi:hypothetical protein